MTKFSLFRFAALATLAASTTLTAPAQALDLDRIERRAGSALSEFMDVARDRYDGEYRGGRTVSIGSFGLSTGGLKSLQAKKANAAKLKSAKLKAAKAKQAKLKKMKASKLKAAAAERAQIN